MKVEERLRNLSWKTCFIIGVFGELIAIISVSAASGFQVPLEAVIKSTFPMRNIENFTIAITAASLYLAFRGEFKDYRYTFLGFLPVNVILFLGFQ